MVVVVCCGWVELGNTRQDKASVSIPPDEQRNSHLACTLYMCMYMYVPLCECVIPQLIPPLNLHSLVTPKSVAPKGVTPKNVAPKMYLLCCSVSVAENNAVCRTF